MKPIPNFTGYFIDESGRVYSSLVSKKRTKKIDGLTVLKIHISHDGYHAVNMFADRKHYYKKVCHLVLETFVSPRPKGMECCHGKNGRMDDSLENLSWGTHKKNCGEDRTRDGNQSRGEKHGAHKLNELQIRVIRRLRGLVSMKAVGGVFNISPQHVCDIQLGHRWAWMK